MIFKEVKLQDEQDALSTCVSQTWLAPGII